MVATFSNLDVRRMFRSGENAGSQVVVKIRLNLFRLWRQAFAKRCDPPQLIRPDHSVYFRDILLNISAVALHQATCHYQSLRTTVLLVIRHLQNRVHRLLLSRIDEAASVHDNDIGLRRLRRKFMTVRYKLTHHDLGINQVLWTAETYKTNLQFLTIFGGMLA